ncbi:MAG: gamma carbonic anhydrase family protein [Acidimicrobiia bacterium]|nr:gamma carbonic anhydrase family protein [Acidimicrobiia bacterium]MDH5290414.1 gamma carbonic anhydrase family protein [Acidimicrobiia bacterium]
MPIYALGDVEPTIHPSAFIHPDAVIIGDVVIGEQSSVWPRAVLRGDAGYIRIGDRTSIQDGTVIHVTDELNTIVGDECVIGHLVHLEGCTIESFALVGSGAVVLHRVVVRSGGLVAANAVCTSDMEVPAKGMAVGIPAKIRPDTVTPDMISDGVNKYLRRVRTYPGNLRRIG